MLRYKCGIAIALTLAIVFGYFARGGRYRPAVTQNDVGTDTELMTKKKASGAGLQVVETSSGNKKEVQTSSRKKNGREQATLGMSIMDKKHGEWAAPGTHLGHDEPAEFKLTPRNLSYPLQGGWALLDSNLKTMDDEEQQTQVAEEKPAKILELTLIIHNMKRDLVLQESHKEQKSAVVAIIKNKVAERCGLDPKFVDTGELNGWGGSESVFQYVYVHVPEGKNVVELKESVRGDDESNSNQLPSLSSSILEGVKTNVADLASVTEGVISLDCTLGGPQPPKKPMLGLSVAIKSSKAIHFFLDNREGHVTKKLAMVAAIENKVAERCGVDPKIVYADKIEFLNGISSIKVHAYVHVPEGKSAVELKELVTGQADELSASVVEGLNKVADLAPVFDGELSAGSIEADDIILYNKYDLTNSRCPVTNMWCQECKRRADPHEIKFQVKPWSNGAPAGCVYYKDDGSKKPLMLYTLECTSKGSTHPNCNTDKCNGCVVIFNDKGEEKGELHGEHQKMLEVHFGKKPVEEVQSVAD